jgi:hypothetical protein
MKKMTEEREPESSASVAAQRIEQGVVVETELEAKAEPKMVAYADTPPAPDEYRENLYSESIDLKNELLRLLADTRAHKVRLLFRLWRGKIKEFEQRHDKLFLKFVDYDKHVAEYTDIVTNPFAEHLANLSGWDKSNLMTQTNASARILFAQWESIRMLFQDISGQIHDLQNQVNNNVILVIAILSLVVAVGSLWATFFTASQAAFIPPVPLTVLTGTAFFL